MSEEGEEDENSLEAYSSKEGEGPIWLFFGCRRRDADWIYRPEMEAFLGQGTCFWGRVVVADLTWREPAVSIAYKRPPSPLHQPRRRADGAAHGLLAGGPGQGQGLRPAPHA